MKYYDYFDLPLLTKKHIHSKQMHILYLFLQYYLIPPLLFANTSITEVKIKLNNIVRLFWIKIV